VSNVVLASSATELARKIRLASGDGLAVLMAQQVPTGPAQLLALVPEPDMVRVVVLDVRADEVPVDRALDLAGRFGQQFPHVAVLLATDRPEDLGLQALRAGVLDLVDPAVPVDDMRQVLRGVEEAASRRAPVVEGAEAPVGRVISVASPKGGVGKTTLATNIAVGLAQQSPQGTVLVDVDVQFGDVAAALDLDPTYTIGDMVSGGGVPDVIGLKALLTQHSSGLQVVPGVRSPIEADHITAPAISQLLDTLKREFRYVVVDTAPGMSDQTLAAFDHTTDLVLITSLDVPGVRGLRKELDVLDELSLPPSTRHIVVNFVDRAGGLSVSDVEATLGRKVDVALPRSKQVNRSTNHGVPIVAGLPRDRVSKDIMELVNRFAPLTSGAAGLGGKHRGWRSG
jgi:pilus assembly protein CpaE